MPGRILLHTIRVIFRTPGIAFLVILFTAVSYGASVLLLGIWQSAYDITELREVSGTQGFLIFIGRTCQLLLVGTVAGVPLMGATHKALAARRGEQLSVRQSLAVGVTLLPVYIRFIVYTTLVAVGFQLYVATLVLGSVSAAFYAIGYGIDPLLLMTIGTAGTQALLYLGAFVVFPAYAIWQIAISLGVPVVAAERLRGWQAVRRSTQLVRRSWYVPIVVGAAFGAVACVGTSFLFLVHAVSGGGLNFDGVIMLLRSTDLAAYALVFGVLSVVFLFSVVFLAMWYYEAANAPDLTTADDVPVQTGA